MTHNEKYLDPPEESEEEYCEECGQIITVFEHDMVTGYHNPRCTNNFCPAKHEEVAKEMAEYIVELLDDLETRKTKIKQLERKITALEFYRDEGK